MEMYETLKARFDTETQQLHKEHQEIVHALRFQFQEYRTTAEQLFYTEAQHFQEKAEAQTRRFEAEMSHVVRTKDFLFSAMVAAKDAKIMSLIDGTDLQKVLIKHQVEMEMLRKTHERDLETLRAQVENEQKKLVYHLKKQISSQQLELDKAQSVTVAWEQRLEQTLQQLKKVRKNHLSQHRYACISTRLLFIT